MRKSILLLYAFILSFTAFTQDLPDKAYPLTTSVSTLNYGFSNILDPYLSPLEYNGYHLGYRLDTRSLYSATDSLWSNTNQLQAQIGSAMNPNKNNSMLFFNINYSYGVNYHLRPSGNWMILVGGAWDIDLGGKYLSRNVNNPFSMDLYTNINATAEIQYEFSLWKQDFRARYGAKTPLLGCMFVPMQGASYYELFSLRNLENAFHFSSLHNRQAWSHYLHLDIPLKPFTLRTGFQHDYLQYSANNIVFHKNDFSFLVGAVIDLYIFKGKKNPIPSNFKSAYK